MFFLSFIIQNFWMVLGSSFLGTKANHVREAPLVLCNVTTTLSFQSRENSVMIFFFFLFKENFRNNAIFSLILCIRLAHQEKSTGDDAAETPLFLLLGSIHTALLKGLHLTCVSSLCSWQPAFSFYSRVFIRKKARGDLCREPRGAGAREWETRDDEAN